ncbi:50S ribosomal protein L13 [Pyrobaculum aerophilum]|uniref:Large ribosomal subunit protein uL13 n=2 Tax=Pyrobaculum aerophilum TaxID=13773 RepID=RL13_PYRAE|nr:MULTISPECIES: 50S ribosomal protein L13 [Pyrobaculum]Q8ZYQ1.1 RecName: Full=Large ribosomal subunit protein uL13; AltName: Full=50S ribosomal protein L13 [Pyrobaculum aerophilum str. IM2]AAL62942.1 ribosomal protein L13 [Pyrobaculum aerophilum str. IM2]MCX8137465.1 50S ribosomal protein L13 [Pyrobaculum aerophilum]RFA94241.1 50S ribosomal protein L13 [Pyrobaculum aerophilum]RFA94678.1 50S ribosomal protein L13 [Pyrobaculum aerophilum]HII46078.1 50S ribosomal protein L13 [Pyrobaculum aeroph
MNVVKRPLDISQLPDAGEVIVDAEGHVAGRLATYIAKALLERPNLRIVVVNAEKLVITGDEKMVIEWFKRKISEWRTHYNPEKAGPKVPRRPDRVFKRIVRGMLPKKSETGRSALKRLRVYMSIPIEIMQRKRLVLYEVPEAKLRLRPLLQYTTLEEVWRSIDPEAWEKWRRAVEVWGKKLKQVASG